MLPKSREVTKIGHTVWPPPINRRKKRKDSAFHSGRVQVLLWCRLCQTATIIIWSLGKRKKRPKAKPTAAAATPNEPKGAKRTRRRHSVQHHHHTHAVTRCNATPHATQSLGAFKFTIFPLRTSQDVVVRSRRHNKTDETPKFNEFQDFKAEPTNSTNLRGFPFLS